MRKIQKNTGAGFSFLQFWWRQLADRVPFSTGITWTRQFDFCGLVGFTASTMAWTEHWRLGWGNGGSGGAMGAWAGPWDLGRRDGSSGGALVVQSCRLGFQRPARDPIAPLEMRSPRPSCHRPSRGPWPRPSPQCPAGGSSGELGSWLSSHGAMETTGNPAELP